MKNEDLLHPECVCSKCLHRKECEQYQHIVNEIKGDPNDWTCANAKFDEDAPISIFDFIGEVEDDL